MYTEAPPLFSVKDESTGRQALNNLLLTLAGLGVFAAFDLIAHKDVSYFWPKLACVLALSAACLLATKERQAWDIFFTVIAALFALCAAAMTAGNRADPNWWPFFMAFVAAAILFTFLTREKRQTLIAIVAILGFRVVVFVIRYTLNT